MIQTCICCGKTSKWRDQFWELTNYFRTVDGVYCVKCYEKISHNLDGNPKHPEEYLMILLKQEKDNGKEKKS